MRWARALTRTRMIKALDLAPGTGGLFAGAKLVRELEDHLEETRIEDLPRSFTAVATDLSTGHEVWLREGAVAGALRASFALPGVFSPIRHGHRFLVDGALVNPVPVSVCRALGADVVIAVNLNSEMLAKDPAFVQAGDVSAEQGGRNRIQATVENSSGNGFRRSGQRLVRRDVRP